MQKYEIIDLKLKGFSNSYISRTFGIARDTVRKYWSNYQRSLSKLLEIDPQADVNSVIEEIVENPHYDVSNRKSRKYNEEIDRFLDKILSDEQIKTERLGPSHKQKLTQQQIYQLIKEAGYDIGKTVISDKIREKRNQHKEVFIKQQYEYGQRFEYDFGEVKLYINGESTVAYIAVLTAPASHFRWAYLYHNCKMDVFLQSQVSFFEMLQGCFEEGVYDNMRNVVSKFIGRNEKEINPELIKLATYYGFHINVTNCYSGNEKGNVESAVKWIRNKTFALKYEFSSFEEASAYLQDKLVDINKDSLIEEEKKHLSFYRPKYETARISVNNVDKYSFITLDNNFYSVPEELVGKMVTVKAYPNTIHIFYNGQCVASHNRIKGRKKTCIDIHHYLSTFLKKPGALKNSTALNSVPELKTLYDLYYKDNPRSFIDALNKYRDKEIDELIKLLNPENQNTAASDAIEEKTMKQLFDIEALFIKGGSYVH